jgi:hypothetical protein
MSPLASVILRWLARLSALFFACVFLVIMIKEFLAPQSGPASGFAEWAGISLLLVAVAGMLLAWKWDLTGALIALAALVLHVAVVRHRSYDVMWFAAVPAVLYLANWLLRRFRTPPSATTP